VTISHDGGKDDEINSPLKSYFFQLLNPNNILAVSTKDGNQQFNFLLSRFKRLIFQ